MGINKGPMVEDQTEDMAEDQIEDMVEDLTGDTVEDPIGEIQGEEEVQTEVMAEDQIEVTLDEEEEEEGPTTMDRTPLKAIHLYPPTELAVTTRNREDINHRDPNGMLDNHKHIRTRLVIGDNGTTKTMLVTVRIPGPAPDTIDQLTHYSI